MTLTECVNNIDSGDARMSKNNGFLWIRGNAKWGGNAKTCGRPVEDHLVFNAL